MTSRYFTSRTQAGQMLGTLLEKDYADQPCAIVALSEGGVMVAANVALKLKGILGLLLVEMVSLPAEIDPIGAISEKGNFSYNNMYSAGQIEELMMDYRGYVEDQKRTSMTKMHTLMGRSSGLRTELLHDKNIFLVSDGLNSGFSLEIALEFLKPVVYRELVVVTPIASPEAVDRMHVLADKIYCLSVVDNYLDTDHYYEHKDVPSRNDVVKIVEEVMEKWQL
jgi:putative phosphoribosyl transferase